MPRMTRVGRCLLAVLATGGMLALPAAAHARLTWSSPTTVDPAGGATLHGLACESVSECTAIDQGGRAVTFNPASPGTPTASVLASGAPVNGLACPSPGTECVAVDGGGREVTFDPASPGTPTAVAVEPGQPLYAVACPVTTQCAAVGPSGAEVTFSPTSSTTPVPFTLASGSTLYAISCPSNTECVAVGGDGTNGTEATFDPGSMISANTTIDPGHAVRSVACPSPTLCVAADDAGQVVQFNPGSPPGGATAQSPVSIDSGHVLLSIACPSVSQCTAVDNGGRELTFSPASPSAASPTTLESGKVLWSVACPSAAQCTAVSADGAETTFNPMPPTQTGPPSPVTIDSSQMLDGVACPAGGQCTAVDAGGRAVTFNPASLQSSSPAVLDSSGLPVDAIACPASSQCTAVGATGKEITFNPASPGGSGLSSIGDDNAILYAVSCPQTFQCTAVDGKGTAVTFDPTGPSSRLLIPVDPGRSLYGVACPTSDDCVAVDDAGQEVEFPAFVPNNGVTPFSIDPGHVLEGVACPSSTECVAVDDAGQVVVFDPGAPNGHTQRTIDGGQVLSGITCPATNACVAVDRAGRAIEGDPTIAATWTVEPIGGAGSLGAVGCLSATNCVAVDGLGHAAAGILQAPVNLVPPTITGNPTVGQTLTEAHGSWTNSPTSFSYQWEDCDSSGSGCQPIIGATLQIYTLAPSDVGHTVAVAETAANSGGSSVPATSLATGVVHVPTAPPTPRAPAVVLGLQTVGVSTAAFSGSVVPNGLATTYHFEYGLDSQYFGGGPLIYGESTADTPVGSDFAGHAVTASVSDLVPNAVYHMRLVATNADGTTTGSDQTFTTNPGAAPPAPVIARSVNVAPVSGVVLIKTPPGQALPAGTRAPNLKIGNGFVPLTQARQIPARSQIDARRGTLTLVSATGVKKKLQKGTFSGALFTVTQTAKGPNKGLTTMTLLESAFPGAPSFASCPARAAAAGARAATLSSKTLQLLHASDSHGRFATKGRYGAATVRGTKWDMADRCDGTLTKVLSGTVSVTDFTTGKAITLTAGQSYLAKAVAATRRR